MSEARFNLVQEPWIPCLEVGASRPRELSLGELVERAGDLAAIWSQSPLETAAVHRLVLAVVHSALRGPAGVAEVRTILSDRRLPGDVSDYLALWSERFELFDGERPFFQQVDPEGARQSPISRLHFEWTSANNPVLFDHHLDDDGTAVSPAHAARTLITHQAYALGGGVNKPFNLADGPLAGRLCVLPQGSTLAETIAFCLVRYSTDAPIHNGEDDAPAWEEEVARVPERTGTRPRGYLDYLTWQSRAIQLLSGDRTSASMYRQNLKLADDPPILDPFVPYRKDDRRGIVFLRPSPDRALWRDLDAIIHGTLSPEIHPHGVLGWAARIADVDAPQGMIVCGAARNPGQAKLEHWVLAQLPMSRRLLSDEGTREALSTALSWATQGERVLTNAVFRLAKLSVAPASEDPDAPPYDKQRVRATAKGLQPEGLYWPQLEPEFAALIHGISAGGSAAATEQALIAWLEQVRRAAQDALERISTNMDGGRALRAANRARESLHAGLAKLAPQDQRAGVGVPA